MPLCHRAENIRVGDSVELLVLSRDDRFTAFKVRGAEPRARPRHPGPRPARGHMRMHLHTRT